ncbi:MAG: site-specific DNA-methyltransferase [Bacteroidia bacterium]|nr:site-specific DNA-methyltransferase [Bacteroidia bacterium]
MWDGKYTFEKSKIIYGDCLNKMNLIPDNSIDLICCDLPYEVTANKSDIMIPPSELWKHYWRIAKPNTAVVLFGQDKFTATMMLSDKNHKYNLIWDKDLPTGFLNANRMPLRSHEDIMVFYKKQPVYNPQKVKGIPNHSKGKPKRTANNNYGDFEFVDNKEVLGDMKHPKSILKFQKPHPSIAVHRTEKPVELIEWIVKTYTNEGALVLDNTAGSGTLGEACLNTNRDFILIEKNPEDFEIIRNRVVAIFKNYGLDLQTLTGEIQ